MDLIRRKKSHSSLGLKEPQRFLAENFINIYKQYINNIGILYHA